MTAPRHYARMLAGELGSPRFKVRFPDEASLRASQAIESVLVNVRVQNERRRFISVETPSVMLGIVAGAERHLDRQLDMYRREYGAEILADFQYTLEGVEDSVPDFLPVQPEGAGGPSLDDVLDVIGAPEAWKTSGGEGVDIAIVDTGVNGTRPEFPADRRMGGWAPAGSDPWVDYLGHGTMCACIAAASRADGGEFDGVAPAAGLISCRTAFYDSELTSIYDYLTQLAADSGRRVVVSNSFGTRTGTPPTLPPGSDFPDALDDAVAAGLVVCFSAGNYHLDAGGKASDCSPTSIWLHKCRADVLTVATSRLDGTMWAYSSRGPGQHAGEPGFAQKPDVTAPTPPDGRVVYGDGVKSLPDGWGTSGACPQVAGLAALLLAANRDADAANVIRSTCRSLGHAFDCQGHGMIDCKSALDAIE